MAKKGSQTSIGEPSSVGAGANAAESAEAKKERRPLDQRIAEATEVLRKLQEQKRKQERAQREQNEKELRELLKAEKLDEFLPDTWRAALTDIRAALTRADDK